MSGRQAVVIAIDGLRAAALGGYGNTWHETPALDALASQSVVVDWMFGESPELADFYSTVWSGGELLRRLCERGAAVTLVTDDVSVAALASSMGVSDVWSLESARTTAASDVSETALAALAAVAAERVQEWAAAPPPEAGRLLWIHARAFFGAWDAPAAMRQTMVDEGDPDPPDFVVPPHDVRTSDADELLGYRAAYAAQAAVLDECLGGLLAAADDAIGGDALTVLVGCRGFALGEHGVVGGARAGLYGEVLQLPCLVHAPDMAPAPARCTQLSVPRDLAATLAAWFELSGVGGRNLFDAEPTPRQFVCATNRLGDRFLRTPAWMMRSFPANDDVAAESAAELYVKPDDRWEANEVSSRCPTVVERLLGILYDSNAGDDVARPPLDEDLVQPAN
jgi:hypothetical protein